MIPGLVPAILFTLGWVPLYLARAEAIGAALPVYRRAEKVSTIATTLMLSVHMAGGCFLLSLEWQVPLLRSLAALVVYGFGIGFWFWGRTMIGPLRRRRMPDEPPVRLRRDGAFGVVRHPMYLGYLIATAGPVVATLNPWVATTYAMCTAMLALRAKQEEDRLRAQLGAQYDRYCRSVKRLVPFVW